MSKITNDGLTRSATGCFIDAIPIWQLVVKGLKEYCIVLYGVVCIQSFLNGELSIPADEAFHSAVHSYLNVFLRCECVVSMVQRGGLSTADFREVFRNNIERRISGLPEIDGLPKETVISSWMSKFDQIVRGDEDPRRWSQRQAAAAGTSEATLSKEQLFDLFQNVLGVRKHEHQILYNAMQVRIYTPDFFCRYSCNAPSLVQTSCETVFV